MIVFDVPGIPRPAGSKRGFPIKRKDGTVGVALVDAAGTPGKVWRLELAHAARAAIGDAAPLEGPLTVSISFGMPRPRKHFRGQRLRPGAPGFHTARPDVDKLVRAVFDALKGITWADDAQVAQVYAGKFYVQRPGVHVRIEGTPDRQDDRPASPGVAGAPSGPGARA